jgi:hypothetical protein
VQACSRALALCAALAEDGAPLDLVPEPWASEARRAHAHLAALDRMRRSASLARETVQCFQVPAPAGVMRALPRGLAQALAPREQPVARGAALADWVEAALRDLPRLGVLALGRAPAEEAVVAERLRRLSTDERATLLRERHAAVDDPLRRRSQAVVRWAEGRSSTQCLPVRIGLGRLGWALAADPDVMLDACERLPAAQTELLAGAARHFFFVASEEASAERAQLRTDREAA